MSVVLVEHEAIMYVTGDLKAIGLKEYVIKRLRGDYRVEKFWANDDISFALEKGDMLGIIGSNGAGKSTLLKGVSGVLEPTRGRIRVRGKIAALLELTAGFDGDLTVRENVFLRGALLGYTKDFIREKYEEIIAFAELQQFQELPFRQLSSGMKSRLAFSIACLVNPDILILDEVLSVGDGAFRKKSEGKIMEILDRGITGMLVSHSIGQVRELCNKVLWLDRGKQVIFDTDVELICDAYEEFLQTKHLPADKAEMKAMSEAFAIRKERELQAKRQRQRNRFLKTLNGESAEEALDQALAVIRKLDPSLLNQEALAGSGSSVTKG